MITFEMKAIDPNSKYERNQVLRQLERLKQPSKVRHLDVVDLPPLGPMDMTTTITYLHKDKPSTSRLIPLSQGMKNFLNEKKGNCYFYYTRGKYIGRTPSSRCKLCSEVGHQVIGCHYHPSVLDD